MASPATSVILVCPHYPYCPINPILTTWSASPNRRRRPRPRGRSQREAPGRSQREAPGRRVRLQEGPPALAAEALPVPPGRADACRAEAAPVPSFAPASGRARPIAQPLAGAPRPRGRGRAEDGAGQSLNSKIGELEVAFAPPCPYNSGVEHNSGALVATVKGEHDGNVGLVRGERSAWQLTDQAGAGSWRLSSAARRCLVGPAAPPE
jgi:hypothetical protein